MKYVHSSPSLLIIGYWLKLVLQQVRLQLVHGVMGGAIGGAVGLVVFPIAGTVAGAAVGAGVGAGIGAGVGIIGVAIKRHNEN